MEFGGNGVVIASTKGISVMLSLSMLRGFLMLSAVLKSTLEYSCVCHCCCMILLFVVNFILVLPDVGVDFSGPELVSFVLLVFTV
jgi:hypothetical protein